MMKSRKPKKRVILYWFVEYGFFFLAASLFITGTLLKYLTVYYSLTIIVLNMTLAVIIISMLLLLYKWITTEYYILKKHLFIKDTGKTSIVPYDNIKEIGYCASLLQHLMGTTNIKIKTKNNKRYYLEGIRNYKDIENDILSKMNQK